MLYSYQYERHPLRKLHVWVCAFLRTLRYGNPDPQGLDIEVCCGGELLERARLGAILRQRLSEFYNAWLTLTEEERDAVYRAFIQVNSVQKQLESVAPRVTLADLPQAIRQPTYNLFSHLYDSCLVRAQVKEHWKAAYERLPFKECPFCGIEPLHHPAIFKQDYDHLLSKATYPFASVNLRNLVPCGRDCNSIFKQGKDLIFSEGNRRKAFYPFHDYGVQLQLSLEGSRLPSDGDDPGAWHIEFTPDIEEVRTWIEVFELERRYQFDVFGAHYTRWIADFVDWVGGQATPEGGWVGEAVLARMETYRDLLETDRIRDRRFLKHALFDFIISTNDQALFRAIAAQLNSRNN